MKGLADPGGQWAHWVGIPGAEDSLGPASGLPGEGLCSEPRLPDQSDHWVSHTGRGGG